MGSSLLEFGSILLDDRVRFEVSRAIEKRLPAMVKSLSRLHSEWPNNQLVISMELYFSVDIEADGPIPGQISMLSLGAAAFSIDETGKGSMVGTWSANLQTLPEAVSDPSTMTWWSTQNEAWNVVQQNKRDPKEAMTEFSKWVKDMCTEHKAKPVFVAYPAGFDFTFVYWYLMKFAGESPFSFSCLDMKSYAMAKLKIPFRASVKRNMPEAWFEYKNKHTHVALEDAIEQGWMFVAMMKHEA